MSLVDFLTSIADAIRSKTGITEKIPASEFAEKIMSIITGIDTSDATAAGSDLLFGKTAYADGIKITGNIETKTVDNIIVSGPIVSVEAGYYDESATKSVNTVAQATPSIAVSSDGLITATATQIEGYVAAGTTSNTEQLALKTSNDMTTDGPTVTVPAGYYATAQNKSIPVTDQASLDISVNDSGLVEVVAEQSAGYVYEGAQIETLQLDTLAAQVIYPGTVNQTIAGQVYLIGSQVIKGDANLVASNIAEGVSIFGVNGTYSATQPEVSVYVYNNTPYTNYAACSAGFVSISSRGGSVTVTCKKNEPFFILMRSSNYGVTDTSNSLNSTFGFLGDSSLYQTIYSDMVFGCVLLDDCSFEIS